MNEKSLVKKTRAYALKNALAHGGKAQQGAVVSALFHEGLKKQEIKKFRKKISEIISEVDKLSVEEKKKEFARLEKNVSKRKVREGLPELPGARRGKVVMRISPSPSGPFHVGHALTASLSFLFVKKYGGKFYVRIEDTNPENIYAPAYKMIERESKWLFDGLAKIQIQSDHMKKYYEYAERLIRKKSAYICTCSGEEFREFVKEKKNCPCRKFSSKENLERWKKMLIDFKPGEAVLRFKSSMKEKNPAMRDFPLARINLTEHSLQKKKYRVWPLMNLAVPVDDIESKMTHIIRAKDHRDNSKRQEMIYKILGKKFPWTGFLGKWHFKGFELSASKMKEGIKHGKFSGWDDEKLPTIAALKKKYKPSAFWKFAERIGLTESDKVIDRKEFFTLLDSFNR